MKKVLLTGQFTDRFREINKGLIGKYEVRSCVNKVEIFKGMFKLNEPDIVVVILDELDKINEALLKELKKETMKNIKNSSYDFEDLASLIYIKSLISPNKEYEKIFIHIFIVNCADV